MHPFPAPINQAILIVDDDLPFLRILRASLAGAGFRIFEARNGKTALELAALRKPSVVLLDPDLPDMGGPQLLKSLREWAPASVIVLSAKGNEGDKVAYLDSGADDYLTKPFGVEELLARIRVALRRVERGNMESEPIYEHGDLKIDLMQRRVWVAQKTVRISPHQYALLTLLARSAGHIVDQGQLIKSTWGGLGEATPESLRLLVHQLRHRIERDPARPRHLTTEPCVGYRLESNEENSFSS